MTDERPRPEYGEYATPEQQAAAMGVNRLEAVPIPGVTPHPLTPAPPYGRSAGPRPPAPQVGQRTLLGSASSLVPPTSHRVDRFFTLLFLVYGLWTVISGLVERPDLTAVAQQVYASRDFGTFTSGNPQLAVSLGLAITITNLVIFVIVAVLAQRLLRRDRIAFWVPLAGGVLAAIVTASCLMVFLNTDPGFVAHITRLGSGA